MECQKMIGVFCSKIVANLCFAICFLFISCTQNYGELMRKSCEEQCHSKIQTCEVSFRNTFDFEWDELYVFDSHIYPEEISDAIGVECDCDLVLDGKEIFIFLHNGQIVAKNALPSKRNISFVGITSENQQGFLRIERDSIYRVTRIEGGNVISYQIHLKESEFNRQAQ